MISHCVIHHWLIDIPSGSLVHQQSGEQRRLGEYQLKLLIVLVQNAGKILTREELNTLVWERRVIGNNSLPNAIHALRVALEDDGKQQRIIKTIPKKGYILEAEYCDFRLDEKQEADSQGLAEDTEKQPLFPQAIASPESVSTLTLAREEWQKESKKESVWLTQKLQARRKRFWRWMCLAQATLLLLVVGFLLLTGSLKQENKITEQVPGAWSNIHLYALEHLNDQLRPTEEIDKQINPSLSALNALLIEHQANMQVFYQIVATTMNYTVEITSRCDRRELVMNIAQFRSDNSQLNALIYRETEREINEMANCVN
ncbi:winged helix-turn-helix domain-containing protein [Erwinia amylovora]